MEGDLKMPVRRLAIVTIVCLVVFNRLGAATNCSTFSIPRAPVVGHPLHSDIIEQGGGEQVLEIEVAFLPPPQVSRLFVEFRLYHSASWVGNITLLTEARANDDRVAFSCSTENDDEESKPANWSTSFIRCQRQVKLQIGSSWMDVFEILGGSVRRVAEYKCPSVFPNLRHFPNLTVTVQCNKGACGEVQQCMNAPGNTTQSSTNTQTFVWATAAKVLAVAFLLAITSGVAGMTHYRRRAVRAEQHSLNTVKSDQKVMAPPQGPGPKTLANDDDDNVYDDIGLFLRSHKARTE